MLPSSSSSIPLSSIPLLKKVGKSCSKNIKGEYPPDTRGADMEVEQSGQGVATSREEKVSGLKTGLVHVARKMTKNMHAHFIFGLMYQRMGQPQKAILAYEQAAEILLPSEEEIDRPDHAQCILLESMENSSSDKEPERHELDEICSKLRESIESDVDRHLSGTQNFWKLLRKGWKIGPKLFGHMICCWNSPNQRC